MTISRMQQPRQLYGLGSLVKKITKPIKKIVKSPIGKSVKRIFKKVKWKNQQKEYYLACNHPVIFI